MCWIWEAGHVYNRNNLVVKKVSCLMIHIINLNLAENA